MKTIGVISLGCPKNLTESEAMLGILTSAGYVVTSSLQDAEIILINTCSFIQSAVKESLEAIFSYAQYKKNGACRYLVVVGCLPQRYGSELSQRIPEVDLWLGANARPYLLTALDRALAGELTTENEYGASFLKNPGHTGEDNSPRLLTTTPATAYLKIAEGCSHACSYCLIPKLRGRLQSRTLEAIRSEASQLVDHGVREITLVAQDTGDYGRDLYGKPSLDRVVRSLTGLPKLRWLRIMYLNPHSLTDELLRVIRNEEKVCRYLDVPFQHASAKVLGLMNRKGSLAANLQIVADLRHLLPGIALRTTLMTGFPGEDRRSFRELLSFVQQAQFERIGVFAYCHEEGAPSYRRQETVSFIEKQRRRRQVYRLQRQISRGANDDCVGRSLPVLIEKQVGAGVYLGRSYREAPDVDPKIIVRGDGLNPGNFATVKITHAYAFDLAGIVTENASDPGFPMLS
ncbi:MAG: 30S ribosomal protein S12 methylthiotransferase RimO [Thermacetogeniaceae bacterium]